MVCEKCGVKTLGIDCEACGEVLPSSCPECKRPFGPADRFCRRCGRNLKYINFSNWTPLRIPRRIEAEDFLYPPDRQSMELLKRTGPVRFLARQYAERWTTPMVHGSLLGSSVKVTDKQFPEIRTLANTCQRILQLDPVEVYITENSRLLAWTVGSESFTAVVLTSGLVENLTHRELLFALGHEMGHIKCNHVFYLGMSRMFTENKTLLRVPLLGEMLKGVHLFFILPWQRRSVITADRAGLLCCQNLAVSIKTLIKMSLGAKNLYDQLDIEEFLRQGEETRQGPKAQRLGEYFSGHPFVTSRVELLEEFALSSACHTLLTHSLDPYRPGFACSSCGVMAYADNVHEGLVRLSCPACSTPITVESMPCPHCGNELPTGPLGMRDVVCSTCKQGYVRHAVEAPVASSISIPDDPYEILGLSRSAGKDEVEAAFLRAARRESHLHDRVSAYRAYRILSDPDRRREHDLQRPYLASLQPGSGRFDTCKACGLPSPDVYCGWCGERNRPAASPPKAVPAPTPA